MSSLPRKLATLITLIVKSQLISTNNVVFAMPICRGIHTTPNKFGKSKNGQAIIAPLKIE